MSKKGDSIYHKSISIIIAPIAIVMLFLFSCTGKEKKMGEAITERDSLPVMQTLGVTSLVSDSGITRYRIETEEWLIYDKKKPSYWAFEKGVYLEKFDSLFNIDAIVKADTAYYYDKQKLWKLVSNVHIQNLKGEKYDTDLLYWDQTTQKLYSDKLIRIEQADRIIIGYGFESDQQMIKPVINNIEGVFYINENEPTDSIN
ncbi:Lipopolysaccharide export system protein LptC [termite gut metagenome]|uniref:Lipopolysaccharide export system protein LptC n=1 Tax=termite gut metagenome TaxID=433724 RepID=A0A5J4SZG4_9ZZZZ